MTICSVQVQTVELLRALKNILELVKPMAGDPKDRVPSVLLSPQSPQDGEAGSLLIIGASPYVAALEEVPIINTAPFTPADIDVLKVAPVKSDVIDDLTKALSALSKTSKARDAVITLEVEQGARIAFYAGTALIAELPAHGTSREYFEAMLSWIDADPKKLTAPVMFNAAVLSRFKGVRARGGGNRAPIVDLAGDATPDGAQAPRLQFKIGETLYGVVAAIDRDLYASGGPWGDGPGTPGSKL